MQQTHNNALGLSLANPIPPNMRRAVIDFANKHPCFKPQLFKWLDTSNQIQRQQTQ